MFKLGICCLLSELLWWRFCCWSWKANIFFLILCAKVGQGCWTLLNCCWKTVYSESRQISFDNDSESAASEARLKSNSCFLCVLPKASIIQSCPCKFHLKFKENYKRIQIKIKYLDFDIFHAQFTHCTSHFCLVAVAKPTRTFGILIFQ